MFREGWRGKGKKRDLNTDRQTDRQIESDRDR